MVINYPNKKKTNKTISYANRGATLEYDINETNEYYLAHNIAVIYKKPIPVQIVTVDYPSRCAAKITEAYYKTPSTTDYNGIYKGRYIDFEVKETANKTFFPVPNIHQHQIDHLLKVEQHGAIAFLIIRFKALNRTFLLFIKDLNHVITSTKTKSIITLEQFEEHAFEIETKFHPRVDYLKVLNETVFA